MDNEYQQCIDCKHYEKEIDEEPCVSCKSVSTMSNYALRGR